MDAGIFRDHLGWTVHQVPAVTSHQCHSFLLNSYSVEIAPESLKVGDLITMQHVPM